MCTSSTTLTVLTEVAAHLALPSRLTKMNEETQTRSIYQEHVALLDHMSDFSIVRSHSQVPTT